MIEMVIDARKKDLGGFEVGRILPFHARPILPLHKVELG